jgi:hypothetical protein
MKKKIVLAVIALFAIVGLSNAQGGRRTVEERVKMTMDQLTPALKLDDTQQKQTDSTFSEFYRSMQKAREAMQPGTPPDRSQYQQMMTDRDEKLKKIFTAEQFKKFKDELEPAMRQRRQGQGQGGQQ